MKIEIRRGKRGESHKFILKIGGVLALGANTLPTLMGRLLRELELEMDVEPSKAKAANALRGHRYQWYQ